MLESLAAGLSVLVPRTGSASDYIDDIYKNGGDPYIYYVDSTVIQDGTGFYKNMIHTKHIVDVLLNIKQIRDDKTYLLLKRYIKKNYSWYKVSTDLYNYLCDILVHI